MSFGRFFVRSTTSRLIWSLARQVYKLDRATKAAHVLDEVTRSGAVIDDHDRRQLARAAHGGLDGAIARARQAVKATRR
jgi:hypothetical protein